MEYRKNIERVFGNHAFDHALFYQYEKALRFELSVSGSAIEMFTTAWRKAEAILSDVLSEDNDLYACWSFYGARTYLSSLSVFREIAGCGIKIPKLNENWCEVDEDDSDYFRHFLLFKISSSTAKSLLWGALAQDLGIRPRIVGKVHLVNLESQILVHPYDDRGMDIYSTDAKLMQNLFDRFNSYLLDYDRDIMEGVYGTL
ncbi:DUF3885 domain-containing protein [Microbulbifer sp. SAOS-129_SWC]|uniref:DUF3885 domain-containing protein n=1 Tax=Microbulbifer sp. SAOS-129_SWC TaxID=3145235 RepID=UPI0032179C9E